jgi:tetratricopeptide (TPR) repeat protein
MSAPEALEQAATLASAGDGEGAVAVLRTTLQAYPRFAAGWHALSMHLHALGDDRGAAAAEARHVQCSTADPRLMRAAGALVDNDLPTAERLLKAHLREQPKEVAAIRMLGELAARLGRHADAENLLARCVELAPGFVTARHHYAAVLYRQNKSAEALAQVDLLLALDPNHPAFRNLKAAVLGRLGDYTGSIALFAGVLKEYPHQAKLWMSYGHALKTAGRRQDCEDAYRQAATLEPTLGEAWWSLANLKTFRFAPTEVATLRAQLATPVLSDTDRLHFAFALGKALEDAAAWEESFQWYAKGNQLRRTQLVYDADDNTAHVQRSRAIFTRAFFEQRQGSGCDAPDPIFIVGLPRAGSTLVEQMLASHPLVEGTAELPDIMALARRMSPRGSQGTAAAYPGVLASFDATALQALGEEYLERTRIQRKTGAPFFIDKMPNNFAHLGLIHLILPKARIIDARRHPLGGGFSAFKQHFARGQGFTYDLNELGRYYHDYVALMAHFDQVLPGRVHRVFYEQMVADTETEVRRLLEYCGLPFAPACLRFHENERAVRTASSEQVRQPIFREGLEQWRYYDTWLSPLKAGLGPVLSAYPGVPLF